MICEHLEGYRKDDKVWTQTDLGLNTTTQLVECLRGIHKAVDVAPQPRISWAWCTSAIPAHRRWKYKGQEIKTILATQQV